MSFVQVASFLLVLAGFIIGAAISERSLKAVDITTQGLIMSRLAPLRKAHLVGIVLVVIVVFFLPAYAWALFVAYFALAAALAAHKIRQLEIPTRCRNGQLASVASVFIGVASGAVLSRFA